jgi:hypothetical protein
VHLRAELDAPVPSAELFEWVGALDRYPAWLDIVRSARPSSDGSGDRADDGPGPAAWDVVLVGRLGPLRRSKRLRMVRMELRPPSAVRFTRQEQDGRDHAGWDLAVDVTAVPEGSHLTMDLSYSGSLWGPALHRLVSAEIEAAKPRLVALALNRGSGPES